MDNPWPDLQPHHLGSDDVDPGHKERVLAPLSVHSSRRNVVDPHVSLMEHVPLNPVSSMLMALTRPTYASQWSPMRFRIAVSLALIIKSSKVPLPPDVSIHSCRVQAGRSQL